MLNLPNPTPINDLEVKVTGLYVLYWWFLVKVSKSLYILTHLIELFDTLPEVSYWSKIFYCIIFTFLSDLDVKITNLEIL